MNEHSSTPTLRQCDSDAAQTALSFQRRDRDAYAVWPIHALSASDVFDAVRIQDDHQLSFWDALIVIAAVRSGAARLYSEDLNPGQSIEGVEVVNPLVD